MANTATPAATAIRSTLKCPKALPSMPRAKVSWSGLRTIRTLAAVTKSTDGTLGHYVHLKKAGCQVHIGDKVTVGQWIGLSGNTGYSTGPHLHFAVFK